MPLEIGQNMRNQAGKTFVHAFLLNIAKMAKLYQYCTPLEEALIVKRDPAIDLAIGPGKIS